MSSNSKNMTLEDKLVQNIKETQLGALIGDEDALAELTKRAVDEALFKTTYKKEGSGFHEKIVTVPPLVVQVAREQAEKVTKTFLDQQFKEIMENPETMKAINDAIVTLLPGIVSGFVDQQIRDLKYNTQRAALNNLMTVFSQIGNPQAMSATSNVANNPIIPV